MTDPHTAQQRKNRRVLTAARKRGPEAVIKAANDLYTEMYTTNVWPDSWSEVQRAHDDAQLELTYGRHRDNQRGAW